MRLVKTIRGQKLPDDTVYIGRPSKWGNPFKVGDDDTRTHAEAVVNYQSYLYMTKEGNRLLLDLEELRGKNLACWCGEWKYGDPEKIDCHGVILMEAANELAFKKEIEALIHRYYKPDIAEAIIDHMEIEYEEEDKYKKIIIIVPD